MAGALLHCPPLSETAGIVVLGLGGGALPAFLQTKLPRSQVTAVDIDSNAAAIAERNLARNAAAPADVFAGNVLTDDVLRAQVASRRYGVILANIVADVIREMLPLFAETLAPGGVLICSGIIAPRAAEVTEALYASGFVPENIVQENDWVALTARRADE